MGFVLSPAAQTDVEAIWNYTEERWGQRQAIAYTQALRDACRGLADGTRPSRPVTIREGYRKASVGSHTVFFRTADDGGVIIVRILHQRMDVEKHL